MTMASDGSVVWYGAILWGLVMIVRGLGEESQSARAEADLSQLRRKSEDLWRRLLANEPIDHIADEYYRSEGIPPIRTIQVAAYLIRGVQEGDHELSRALAAYFVSDQIVDSDVDPEHAIDNLSFRDQVYYFDDDVLLCQKISNFGHTPGTMVLNRGFLFFFERSLWSNTVRKMADALRGGPVILATGYELVGGLSRSLTECFDERRKARLKKRFGRPRSHALPLCEIVRIGPSQKEHVIGTTHFVEIEGQSKDGQWRCLFTSGTLQGEDWARSWIERVQIACIPEGNMLD